MNRRSMKVRSNTYSEVGRNLRGDRTESGWRDGLITGNGEQGVICSCSPYSDTLIYQNIFFNMPSGEPRYVPLEVTDELHEARQAVINFDDKWNVNDRIRTYNYCFHPGHPLRLSLNQEKLINYERQTDFEKAEVALKYTDKHGIWKRKTFCSREDNVTITEINQSDKSVKLDLSISIDDLSDLDNFGNGDEVNLLYKKLVDVDCSTISMVAHYPAYEGSELAEGGYAGVTKVITIGGVTRMLHADSSQEIINVGRDKNPYIHISGADTVILISKTARTYNMGKLSDFAGMETYDIVDKIIIDIDKVVGKYKNDSGIFIYDFAMESHKGIHSELYKGVEFCLGDENGKYAFNEELLVLQKNSRNLINAFVERIYNQGRYAQICSAGTSAPRLCGLWTGEWNPGWRGAYTMDANVNIQVSGMNTGNMYNAGIGYIYFILRQLRDWEENAAMVYNMKDALLVPVNTDGDRALMVEYDKDYPFQYWNAGISWMILPIFEFWQCFGNRPIPVINSISHIYKEEELDLEKDILYPLLIKQAKFWEQLCSPEYYTNKTGKACYEKGKKILNEGEKYIILPSYSPENKPLNYNSAITANATMDISAARDGLKMAIMIEKKVRRDGFAKNVEKWEDLINKLPVYKYDENGALCEWAMNEYEENNEHRHISHLYCAWPAYETRDNEQLTWACNYAIDNRNRENQGKDDTASHGWVHKALVAARLKNSESVYSLLHTILSSNIYFSSLMTDHNTDRNAGVYCTDTSFGLVGIINEILLYSSTGEIDFLPALPNEWTIGSISGLMTRTNAQVTLLDWNLEDRRAKASILSYTSQHIRISCGVFKDSIFTSSAVTYRNGDVILLNKNEEISFDINLQ